MSQSRLNPGGQCAEIRDPLKFIVGQLNVKMILQLGQEIERLQAIDSQRFEKVIVRSEPLPRNLEVGSGKIEDFS
jgi:hypothetical protein